MCNVNTQLKRSFAGFFYNVPNFSRSIRFLFENKIFNRKKLFAGLPSRKINILFSLMNEQKRTCGGQNL